MKRDQNTSYNIGVKDLYIYKRDTQLVAAKAVN